MRAAEIESSRAGSDRYQQQHMGMIFSEDFSFSGFERNKVFLGRIGDDGLSYADLSDISGADSEGDCRAAVVADFDDDGDPDLFVNAIQRDGHMLYRNDEGSRSGNGFVKVRLAATKGHPDAIGAIIRVRRGERTVARVLACGSGFESQEAAEMVFGLGQDTQAHVSVRWPGRAEEDFGVVRSGQRVTLVEGAGKPKLREARTFAFQASAARGLHVGIGDTLPPLTTANLVGAARAIKTATDKPTLVSFWATTCSSCVAELPELQRIHTEGRYQVISVSLDPEDRTSRIQELIEKTGVTFDVLRLDHAGAEPLFDLARLSIPVAFVIGKDGRIERVLSGRIHEGDL